MLKRLPFHIIKIDKSFADEIAIVSEHQITASIINLLKQLGYLVIAEGLESYHQLYHLKQWGCDFAQGYLMSKPLSEDQLAVQSNFLSPT
nr:EAL domain-containing protein [Paenibacillus cremeus]